MNEKEAYQQKIQAQLDEWKAELDKLRAKANKAEADTKIQTLKEIESLEQRRDDAKRKLTELSDASGNAWQDLKRGLDEAVNSFSSAFKSAKNRF